MQPILNFAFTRRSASTISGRRSPDSSGRTSLPRKPHVAILERWWMAKMAACRLFSARRSHGTLGAFISGLFHLIITPFCHSAAGFSTPALAMPRTGSSTDSHAAPRRPTSRILMTGRPSPVPGQPHPRNKTVPLSYLVLPGGPRLSPEKGRSGTHVREVRRARRQDQPLSPASLQGHRSADP